MRRLLKFTTKHTILLCLCFISPVAHSLRILGLFPFRQRSHFAMCGELMKGLAAKGHYVDVYSHYPLENPPSNYRDYSLIGSLPGWSNNMTYEVIQASNIEEMIKNWLDYNQHSICKLLGNPLFQKLIHDPPKDPPYDLIVTEICVFYCFLPFGRLLNVPVVGVVTFPLLDWQFKGFGTPINLATDPTIFSPHSAPMTFFQRLNNVITHTRSIRSFYEYSSPQEKYIEKYFGPGFPSIADLHRDVSLVLINHDNTLMGAKAFTPKVIPVGGLHIVDHNETLTKVVQKWLDESKEGCIYFSFGSMVRIETFPKHILDAFYNSFRNIAPVRVLWKIAKPEELPPGLPSNVLTQPWLQQIAVLKHKNIKAFVTHGGLMGTQESVYFGVPMVGIPLFCDQFFSIKAYVQRNLVVQVNLQDVTEVTFTNALDEILRNPLYQKSINKISQQYKDKPVKPIDNAVFWVEYVHRYGKDSLKSPVEDLAWWQASLLDVYAFITILVLLSLFLCTIILKKCINSIYILLEKVSYTSQNFKIKRN